MMPIAADIRISAFSNVLFSSNRDVVRKNDSLLPSGRFFKNDLSPVYGQPFASNKFSNRFTPLLAVRNSSGLEDSLPANKQEISFLRNVVGPNSLVLDAQSKVCTGPNQTRPLSEEPMRKVLQQILLSAKGELPVEDQVSEAQMGAFFGAMAVRSSSFPVETQWSEGEKAAMAEFWPELTKCLPPAVQFLADPCDSIFEGFSGASGRYSGGGGQEESRVVEVLKEVLMGQHLGFEETKQVLSDILPSSRSISTGSCVNDALVAAFLIAIRMNRETDRELKAFCMTFEDNDHIPVAHVKSLTHYGEPYDGSTRFFRSTLFTAAVRASYGETCLLHGTDLLAPKYGVTEELMLKELGAAADFSPAEAAALLEDSDVGFAYLSMRVANPRLHSLTDMRRHIKKRPTFATTEKVQRLVKATGRESMVAGFYHEGYEEPLLMLMRRLSVQSGLVVKGDEGSSCLTTRERNVDLPVKGRPMNFCSGFRPKKALGSESTEDGILREAFSLEVDARKLGFEPSPTPRTDNSASKNVKLGLSALRGEKGPAYDRIVLNAAMADHLLGCDGADDIGDAIERAKAAIDSGKALQHLERYISRGNKLT